MCEVFRAGLMGQPASTITSLAFVVAGLLILARPARPRLWAYALLVIAVGVGSVVQHGPHPSWQAYAHDLPLAAMYAFVAADAAADLTGRSRRAWWWLAPTVALVPLIAVGPAASIAGQAPLVVAAIGLSLLRAYRRPALRRTLFTALFLLAAGALIGTLGERPPLCRSESLWQAHAVWHLLAATALWRLAPAIGTTSVRTPGAPHD